MAKPKFTAMSLAAWLGTIIDGLVELNEYEQAVRFTFAGCRYRVTTRLIVEEGRGERGGRSEHAVAMEEFLRACVARQTIRGIPLARSNCWQPAATPPLPAVLGWPSRRVVVDTNLGNSFRLTYQGLKGSGSWERVAGMQEHEHPAFWIDEPRF